MSKKEVLYSEFPYSEYKLRLEKAKEEMEKHNIDAYLLFNSDNLRYYAGFSGGFIGYLNQIAIIPRDGEPVAIAVHDEFHEITSWVEDIRTYRFVWLSYPDEPSYLDFHLLLLDAIKELGLEDKTLGLDPNVPWFEFEAIKADLYNAKIIDASNAIMEQRMIKTSYEQEVIREHNNKYTRAMRRSIPQLREGMTIGEWYTIAIKSFIDEGLCLDQNKGSDFSINAIGPGPLRNMWLYGKVLNPGIWETRFKRGDMFYTDAGPSYKGQDTDVQRNICIGKVPAEVKKTYKGVLEAQLAGINALAPGVKAINVHRIMVDTLKKHNLKLGMPTVGHGLPGPQYANVPEFEFMPGMFVTIETLVVTPKYQLFPEDNILITDDGHDAISLQLSSKIWEV